jgi:hypothetical protein
MAKIFTNDAIVQTEFVIQNATTQNMGRESILIIRQILSIPKLYKN